MKNLKITSLIFLILSFSLYAQTISVHGNIVASRLSVNNASVTFIDNADTTNKFSALTDDSGNYEVNLNVTSVNSGSILPAKFKLEQNYPNPFSSSTNIPYGLNKVSDVKVTIYDILGRVVRKFNVGWQSKGVHNILWNGLNSFGQKVATGVYFYRLSADGESQVKKMVFNQNGKGFLVPTGSYSLAESSPPEKASKLQKLLGNTFTIRIQNTSNTEPLIVSKEVDNVVIQRDTTINFSLTYIPEATVDLDSLQQIIRGFGASNILIWRPDMTSSEINTAFGTGDGQLGFTILRIMLEQDSTRWSLYLPTAKKALAMGAKIIASPWYAPSNMVETVNGVSRVKHDMYAEYAAHINAFIKYMATNGVPIYGVSVQNEPDSRSSGWTIWTSDEMLTFMKDYANLIKGTKVMDPESFHFNRSYSDPILTDSAACANTDIICGHIYGAQPSLYPLAEEKGKEVWMTEYLINSGNPPTNLSIDTGWTGAMQTAQSINSCMNADMSAYVYWYIERYYGLFSDGTYLTKGEVTKKGYVMSQFSRFIRPGYHRVESSVYPFLSNVSVTAYKDSLSSKVVIVAVNSNSTKQETVLKLQNIGANITFTPYTTSESKNCEKGSEFNVTDGNMTYILEPQSVTTFVSK